MVVFSRTFGGYKKIKFLVLCFYQTGMLSFMDQMKQVQVFFKFFQFYLMYILHLLLLHHSHKFLCKIMVKLIYLSILLLFSSFYIYTHILFFCNSFNLLLIIVARHCFLFNYFVLTEFFFFILFLNNKNRKLYINKKHISKNVYVYCGIFYRCSVSS